MFLHPLRRDQAQNEQHTERDDRDVVELANDQDEVPHQIDRRQRIGRHRECEPLRVSRCAQITRSQPYPMDIALDRASPLTSAG